MKGVCTSSHLAILDTLNELGPEVLVDPLIQLVSLHHEGTGIAEHLPSLATYQARQRGNLHHRSRHRFSKVNCYPEPLELRLT
jgi:hypothetical protein